jgi:flagellar motility protein MotE (MotC chaperone)
MSTPKKPPSPPRLLPALMVTAAVLLGLKTVAFAEGASETTPAPKAAPSPDATKAGEAPAADAVSCAVPGFAETAGLSPSEVQVLQSLGARRELLDQRVTEMDTRQELLAAAERRVEDRIAELKRLEARVQDLFGAVDDEQNKRIAGLVDVYQRMRAKDAAAVFNELDEEVLVDVASRMRQANLAEVMGKMEPARARRLTILLAQQRAADVAAVTRPVSAAPPVRPPASAAARPKAG